ncbi:MAG: SDR family oxidoreductase [Luteitalea sp.]|nr:SDR family oxidoreductase [Luteitalea sp.]
MEFDGRVAVVTGAATGIGQATATMLATRGARVAVVDVNEVDGAATVSNIRTHGGRASFYQADVSAWREVEAAIARARHELGPVDLLVSSAGIQRYGDALTTSDALWDEVMDVNLRGAWHAARACLPDMRHRGGAIVNVASVQGLASQRNVLAYTVSKHGVIGLTRSMAMDFAGENIRVNAVCPGTVDTPMLHRAASLNPKPEAVVDACRAMHPIGRIATPTEVAEVIAFLAHERASFVTGAVWTVDGGLLTLIGGTPRVAEA